MIPDGDYDRITREMGARRVNLAMPEESLLLLKATGERAAYGRKAIREGERFLQCGIEVDRARERRTIRRRWRRSPAWKWDRRRW